MDHRPVVDGDVDVAFDSPVLTIFHVGSYHSVIDHDVIYAPSVPAVKVHDERLRARLLRLAAATVASSGLDALSVRRLADDAGTSTMAVYTLFGEKAALVDEVFIDGFERLGRALERATRDDDPLQALLDVGLAYRVYGLRNPNVYDLLFHWRGPTRRPRAAEGAANVPLEVMRSAIRRCIEAGVFQPIDVDDIAYQLWGIAHGLVSLELTGCIEGIRRERDRRYQAALIGTGLQFLRA